MKCPKCDHEWNYKGKSSFYVTCPNCYRKIRAETKQLTTTQPKEEVNYHNLKVGDSLGRKLKETAENGIDGLRDEKKDMSSYEKMHEELQKKHDDEAKRLEKQFGKDFRKMGRVCFIEQGNTLEFWCNDCKNGFDTFTGGSDTRFCPYCGKKNIRIRKPDWTYGQVGGDDE